jgi:perosamine synthetase
MKKISLACTNVPLKAYLNVFDCLWSGRLGRGKYVQELEERFANYFGAKYVIAVSNGTIADIVMLRALAEMNPGRDEVILPALTFIAHANAVLWAGLKPVFVDVDDDCQMNEAQAIAAATTKTLCYFPANLIGKQALRANTKLLNVSIPLLEDCCESMGGHGFTLTRGIRAMGRFGLAGSFSMYPSHTITTGEGGLIITDNREFAEKCRSIHNHGKRNEDFDFDYLGINGKMTNLQAAIGCALVDTIGEVNRKRRENVAYLCKELGENFKADAPHCFPVIYENRVRRDAALAKLADHKIEARKLMGCIPDEKPFTDRFGHYTNDFFPNARRIANCGLFVPIHQNLTEKELFKISYVLKLTR